MTVTDNGSDAGVWAKLSASLDGLRRSTERTGKWLTQASAANFSRLFGTDVQSKGTYPSSGVLTLDLGAPGQGSYWLVRQITVGGVKRSDVRAGTADVYVCGTDPTNTLQVIDWRDTASALPLIAFYGRGEMHVSPGSHLWVVFSGGTSGQQYNAAASVEVVTAGALQEAW